MSDDRLVPLSATAEGREDLGAKQPFEGDLSGDLTLEHEPRSVGELLDQALEVMCAGFFRYVLFAAVIFLPERLLVAVVGVHNYFDPQTETINPDELMGFMVALMIPALVSGLFHIFVTGVVAKLVYSDLTGQSMSVGTCIARVIRLLPKYILVTILVTMANMAATALCILPVLFTFWKLYLIQHVLLIEETTLAEGFRRGWDLSTGSFFRFWGLAITTFIISQFPTGVAGMPYAAEIRYPLMEVLGVSGFVLDMIFVPLGALLMAAGVVFWAAIAVVYYGDQRNRIEGNDLKLQLSRLEDQHMAAAAEAVS